MKTALENIRKTLDGSQPIDVPGAVMAIDCLIRRLEENPQEWCFDRLTVTLPIACVHECSAAGDCNPNVEEWVGRLPEDAFHVWAYSKVELPEAIRAELKEFGAWDADDLADDTENRKRIIWIAACNIKEELRNNETKTQATTKLDAFTEKTAARRLVPLTQLLQ